MDSNYKYEIGQCDLPEASHSSLQSFREKRSVWLSWIDKDEHHAISQVLSSMAWADVSFRTLQTIATTDESSSLHNALLSEMLHQGYFASQLLAIRRLADNRKKGAISIKRLLKDMAGNIKIFTRENFICFDGLPYDYAKIQDESIAQLRVDGPSWGIMSGPLAYGPSQLAHEQFDRLSGVTVGNRKRLDKLPDNLFSRISEWFDSSGADEVIKWTHAFLAHAGDPHERGKVTLETIKLDRISDIIRTFSRITEALSRLLNSGGLTNSVMPHALFDQFELLENPILVCRGKIEPQDIWNKLSSERNGYLDDLEQKLVAHPT